VLQQPIQDRRGNDRVPKDLPPLAEALVGGQHPSAALIAARDELEEEMGTMLIQRDVADLVDDQQFGQPIVLEALLQSILSLRFGQRGDQAHGCGEQRTIPLLDGFQAQGGGQRGFPRAWRA
jgi:hypothetical protein